MSLFSLPIDILLIILKESKNIRNFLLISKTAFLLKRKLSDELLFKPRHQYQFKKYFKHLKLDSFNELNLSQLDNLESLEADSKLIDNLKFLPLSLNKLISHNYDKDFILTNLPTNIKDLEINFKNSHDVIIDNENTISMLKKFKLINGLIEIVFSDEFNSSVDNLPDNITSITFGDKFNRSVDNLPDNITSITFGSNFNHSVDNLPDNITSITFGSNFNHSVDNLPKQLKYLKFGYNFVQSVDNLPSSLISLEFGYFFNMVNVDNLPSSLINLTFGHDFDEPFNNLPSNLKYLKFDEGFNKPINNNLPPTLTTLIFSRTRSGKIDGLPSTLTHLEIGWNFRSNDDLSLLNLTYFAFRSSFHPDIKKLPLTLTYLELDSKKVDINILNSLSNLKYLILGYNFNQSIDNLLANLIELKFDEKSKFNFPINNLPSSLISLTLGRDFNQLVDQLPINLKYLTFGENFNQKVDNLPSSLISLIFGEKFNKSVDKLPLNLKHLELGFNFNQPIDKLPSNLVTVKLKNKSKININDFLLKQTQLRELYFIKDTFDNNCKDIFFPNYLNVYIDNVKLDIYNNIYKRYITGNYLTRDLILKIFRCKRININNKFLTIANELLNLQKFNEDDIRELLNYSYNIETEQFDLYLLFQNIINSDKLFELYSHKWIIKVYYNNDEYIEIDLSITRKPKAGNLNNVLIRNKVIDCLKITNYQKDEIINVIDYIEKYSYQDELTEIEKDLYQKITN